VSTYLVAMASVHVTAAAADYLDGRLDPDDSVVVVAVAEPDAPERDVHDAANVARARLAASAPTVEVREGDPVSELRAAIADHDPDVVVIGPNAGTADAAGLGTTARAILARADRPVVVVPTDLGDGSPDTAAGED